MTIEGYHIRPVEGRRVRDPGTKAILEAPATVPRTTYWARRLRDGDVALSDVKPPVETAPKKPKRGEKPRED